MTVISEHIGSADSAPAASASANSAHDKLALLVRTIQGSVSCDHLLHPALGIIERYDHENQTDLLKTLEVYLENDCNAQKCGRLLSLHRNSLVYRIHRIQVISGCNLSDPEERSYLRISFLLRR